MLRTILIAVALATMSAAPGLAQNVRPGAPAAIPASKNLAAAVAGTYVLDQRHASVIARMAHDGGFSYSTFRFGDVKGTLDWNPADVTKSKVSVTISMAAHSIMTPVEGFGADVAGERYLKAAQFPEAKFVSTAIEKTGPTTGKITGDLTFMGVTKPVVIDAELVGAGAARGQWTIGFSGKAHFSRAAFGYTSMQAFIGDDIEMLLDVQFDKAP